MDKPITINRFYLFSPLIAAQLLNVYYSALLVNQQKGIVLTPEIESETLKDVLFRWWTFQTEIDELIKKQQTDQKPVD